MSDAITVRERWLAAICYVPLLVFITVLATRRTDFVARHARQGFALLLTEVVGFFFIRIIEGTLGQIPVLGFLVVILLNLVFFLAVLAVSVLGFTRALFGEDWRLPYLDDLADKVPIN
ncbi:MAG: hypothetical protein GY838_02855 [bacterium]|nr:hypothetical protein [bacterium]